jgi:release factor glutamine methyltransferase
MTVSEALREAAQKLQPKRIVCDLDRDVGRLEAEILLAHVLKRDRAWLLAHPEYEVRGTKYALFSQLVSRRANHEPVAYILGRKEFYGRDFKVTPDVLIPRPETELIVDLVKRSTKHEVRSTKHEVRSTKHEVRSTPFILDLGTGSGALAVTLAKEIDGVTVLATDISPKALAVARRNAKNYNAKNISFLVADLLDVKVLTRLRQASKKSPMLIIAANLPYLPESDKKNLDADVVEFEPSGALFAGQDGLTLIKRFLTQLARHQGSLGFETIRAYFEFDPPQAADLKRVAQKLLPKAKILIHKDLANRNRILEISI